MKINNSGALSIYTQKEMHLIFEFNKRLRIYEEKSVLILLKHHDIHERNILNQGKTKRNVCLRMCL